MIILMMISILESVSDESQKEPRPVVTKLLLMIIFPFGFLLPRCTYTLS